MYDCFLDLSTRLIKRKRKMANLKVYEDFHGAAKMAVSRPPLYWDKVHKTVVCAYCHHPSGEHEPNCEFKKLKDAVHAFEKSDAAK